MTNSLSHHEHPSTASRSRDVQTISDPGQTDLHTISDISHIHQSSHTIDSDDEREIKIQPFSKQPFVLSEPVHIPWAWKSTLLPKARSGELTLEEYSAAAPTILLHGNERECACFDKLVPKPQPSTQPTTTSSSTADASQTREEHAISGPKSKTSRKDAANTKATSKPKKRKKPPSFGSKSKDKAVIVKSEPKPAKKKKESPWANPDRTWSPPVGVTSTFQKGMYSNQWSRPPLFTTFIQKHFWGKAKTKLGFTGYHWCPDHDVLPDSEWDLLIRKLILPYALVNIPFAKGLCEKVLTKLVRLCITNRTSMCVITPYRPKDPTHKAIYESSKHGYVLLKNKVSFLRILDQYSRPGVCSTPIIILFLNFPESPKISVDNDLDGIWDTTHFPFHKFNACPNKILVQAHKQDFSHSQIKQISEIVEKSKSVEIARLASREITLQWPKLDLNTFHKLHYGFNIFAQQWHTSKVPDPLWNSHFPGMTKPQNRRVISYSEYNNLCGDDSKLFKDNISYENHLCKLCGKVGHPQNLCWRRIRTSKDMNLCRPTDIILNKFILSFPPCKPFSAKPVNISVIEFINNIQRDITNRASLFSQQWNHFAQNHKVRPSLIDPGFGQFRQGLPYWYALGCPTFILQWIAFGIPVFWTDLRPETFEVQHEFKKGTPRNSHPEIIKQMQSFHKLGCLLPIRRNFTLGCAPLFTRESSGKIRCIHDLRYVNRFILALKFTLTTTVNFCALCVLGTVFLTTDFSKRTHSQIFQTKR